MKKLIITISMLILLTNCSYNPVEVKKTDNDNIDVELLLNIDSTFKPGVYRFYDNGYHHYFVISNNTETFTNRSKYKEEIKTITK